MRQVYGISCRKCGVGDPTAWELRSQLRAILQIGTNSVSKGKASRIGLIEQPIPDPQGWCPLEQDLQQDH
jgi:hypothetical protein